MPNRQRNDKKIRRNIQISLHEKGKVTIEKESLLIWYQEVWTIFPDVIISWSWLLLKAFANINWILELYMFRVCTSPSPNCLVYVLLCHQMKNTWRWLKTVNLMDFTSNYIVVKLIVNILTFFDRVMCVL